MSFTCPQCGQQSSCWSQVGKPIHVPDGIVELARGHRRYEYLRKLNPQQFKRLYLENLETGVAFDTLVDGRIEAAASC
jgi:hypothetical protein